MMKTVFGKKTWALSCCFLGLYSTGMEPEFTTHDKIAVLNGSGEDARIEITCFFEDGEPVGPFKLEVKSKKVRKLRLNDLIDPQALELGKAFSCIIEADVPVVVQFSRLDSGQKENAQIITMACPVA